MKIFNVNVDDFAMVLQQCKGQVVMVTEEGDRLVSNSVLSALIGLSHILHVASIQELEFECELPEDGARILSFLMQHMSDQEDADLGMKI